MAKARTTAFFRKECGYEPSKWTRQCPACEGWNSLVEEPVFKTPAGSPERTGDDNSKPAALTARSSLLSEIDLDKQDKIPTGFRELGRMLGDGIVTSFLVLVGGDPGMGKSTLLPQVCRHLAKVGQEVLYVSGEESLKQIKMRANHARPVTGEPEFLCEASLEYIEQAIDAERPQIAAIDSIQTMYREEISSAPGSVSQVRESTNIFMQIAKSRGIAAFVVEHATKEGVTAGPRVLERMADTVPYFEGDRHASYRILRGVKNRFGFANEIGVFEMQKEGLVEVEDPSEYMLGGQPEEVSGVVVSCSFEGTRLILLEVQTPVTETNFGMPRYTAADTGYNRVNLPMAVLEKRYHYKMSRLGAYVNIAGGIEMNEPALDLAVVVTIIFSYRDRPMDPKMLIFGEAGLSGEVRAVSQAGQRVNEVARLGFAFCVLPEVCADKMKPMEGVKIVGVINVREAIGVIQEGGSG